MNTCPQEGSAQATWLLHPDGPPLAQGYIQWHQGKITDISPGVEKGPESGTTFLTPGLINTHTHLELYQAEMILPTEGAPLTEWLSRVLAFTRTLTDDDKRRLAGLSAQECLHYGTTTVNDVSSTGMACDVLDALGMRGIVSLEFFAPSPSSPTLAHSVIDRVEALKDQWKKHPRLSIGVSPHSPYHVAPGWWQSVVQALPQGTPVHSHLAESPAERDYFLGLPSAIDEMHQAVLGQRFGPEKIGVSPTQAIERCLNAQTTLAHGVLCTPEDVDILIHRNVGLAHCPRSNTLLTGQTIANLSGRLAQGMRLGLGTDSRLSCPDLDLRAEGRFAQQTHGLSAQTILMLCTLGGARALHQEDHLGQLKPSYCADMVLWYHPDSPWDDPYAQWLSPQTRVHRAWVAGQRIANFTM